MCGSPVFPLGRDGWWSLWWRHGAEFTSALATFHCSCLTLRINHHALLHSHSLHKGGASFLTYSQGSGLHSTDFGSLSWSLGSGPKMQTNAWAGQHNTAHSSQRARVNNRVRTNDSEESKTSQIWINEGLTNDQPSAARCWSEGQLSTAGDGTRASPTGINSGVANTLAAHPADSDI